MNYVRIYNELINNSVIRGWTKQSAGCYTERHHVLPKSLGGNNEDDNLVVLTAREHFIAHWLLYKIHRTSGMAHAWNMMCVGKTERYVSRSYKYAKESFVDAITGDGNPFFGKSHSRETKARISDALKKRPPMSESTLKLKSDNMMGNVIWLGKNHSDETKVKMSISNKNRKFRTCPHCGTRSQGTSMNKYHFDNCIEHEIVEIRIKNLQSRIDGTKRPNKFIFLLSKITN